MTGDAEIVQKELIFHRLVLPAVEHNADKPCTIDASTGAMRTFGQHFDRVQRVAGGLRQLGVTREDRYAVMTMNSPEHLELFHAAMLGAGVVNPLNLRFAAAELAYVLKDSGTKVCFVDKAFAPLIQAVKAEAGLEHVIGIGFGVDDVHEPGAFTAMYEDLLASSAPVVPDEGQESDPAILMYTGGTTGMPKGVLLSQRGQILNAYHFMMKVKLDGSARYLMQTPMFHAASTWVMIALPATGGLMITVPMFDPVASMNASRTYAPTITTMVPTMFGMVLAHPAFTPDAYASFTDLAYGASPMPQALLEKLLSMYPDVNMFQAYGMTEASPLLTLLSPEAHRAGGALLRSAGQALPGVVLSIHDDDGNLLPPGERGEVCARGGNYMLGYWNKPEATAEVFRGGWYHTGDAGYLDENGYLYLVDRVKDMIVSGGENVYSAEVENAIASHPAVLQVAVIGIPDDKWGEAVHAIVVLREGHTVTEAELIAHARTRIAGYKLPRGVSFRNEPLPLSGAMKVLKRELRAPFWAGRDRQVG